MCWALGGWGVGGGGVGGVARDGSSSQETGKCTASQALVLEAAAASTETC